MRLATVAEIERCLARAGSGAADRAANTRPEARQRRHEWGALITRRSRSPGDTSCTGRRPIATWARSCTSTAGHALSLQYHNRKEETILLWAGHLLFEIEQNGSLTRLEMKPGDRVHVAPKTVHRMTAIEDCDIFEVSTPELDDVVRLEDRYGREDAQQT